MAPQMSKKRARLILDLQRDWPGTFAKLTPRQMAVVQGFTSEERAMILSDHWAPTSTKIAEEVNEIFSGYFGMTPLAQRLADIHGEHHELQHYNTLLNLKEEYGDLLASLIQLGNESGWNFAEAVRDTLTKIKRRNVTYSALGRKKKIGLLGGAFDPITIGHTQMAQFVLDNSGTFDEVWLMPAFRHMHNKPMQSAAHRLAMCRLATEVDRRLSIFDYEIAKQLAGETYYMVQQLLREEFAKDVYDFSVILGLDVANSFPSWRNYQYLKGAMRFVVVGRQGYQPLPDAWYTKDKHIYLPDEAGQILNTSSTQVRELLAASDPAVANFADPKVLEYIRRHELYSAQPTTA